MMSNNSSRALTWPDLIAAAATPGAVIGVVRDYVACWRPEELGALPPGCFPPKFLVPEDVVLYTFNLVQHEMRAGETHPDVLRLSAFFSQATRRITQLMGELPQQAAANTTKASD